MTPKEKREVMNRKWKIFQENLKYILNYLYKKADAAAVKQAVKNLLLTNRTE